MNGEWGSSRKAEQLTSVLIRTLASRVTFFMSGAVGLERKMSVDGRLEVSQGMPGTRGIQEPS
jgi:hypothetical protein